MSNYDMFKHRYVDGIVRLYGNHNYSLLITNY